MNLLVISLLAVVSLSFAPARIVGTSDKQDTNGLAAASQVQNGGGEIWQEDDREVLIRNERGTKNNNNNNGGTSATTAGKKGKLKKDKSINNNNNNNKNIADTRQSTSCRYVKSPWTECDPKANTRSRTLTLKKGEEGCVQTRTIQKKCKKACRYEKGAWSECTSGLMSRTDKLKTSSDEACQATRLVNKNCNPGKTKPEKNANKEQRPAKNGNKDKGGRKSRA